MKTITYVDGMGSITYRIVHSRPNLAQVVSVVSMFMIDLARAH